MRVFVDQIVKGAIFDTEFESGCIALESPRDFGNFDAIDSDGVVCEFNAKMVVRIHKWN